MIYDLKWMNIKQNLLFNTLMFVGKMKKGEAPKYLCLKIKYVGLSQPYMLRNTHDFRILRMKSTQIQKTLFYKGPRLYNLLTISIKNEVNENIFKRKYINFVLFNDL